MTVIKANMPWPPRAPEVSARLNEWSAWYSGQVSALDAVYGSHRERPSLASHGLFGVARMALWGRPPSLMDRDNRVHMPLAADIAAASADLLFGEELRIDWGTAPATVVDAMDGLMDGLGWQSLLTEGAELSAALGGVYLRAGWDEQVADQPLATVVHADRALPTFAYGRLRAVTFWTILEQTSDGRVVRHLETHEPGAIRHAVYVGTRDNLGSIGNLLDHEDTAELAAGLTDGDRIVTGTQRLTAVYVPNVRPAPCWRNVPAAAYLGRADIGNAGVTGLMDSLDETWTSWRRDIRHGRTRIFAARSALMGLGPGNGMAYDEDREVYDLINVPPGEQDPTVEKMITVQQFKIRTEEHRSTIRELVLAVVQGSGYSGSTFGLDTEVAKTATEVGAVRQRTAATREKKTRYWTPALEQFLGVLGDLHAVHFRGGTAGLEPKVSFPATSTPTMLELAQTAMALKNAEAASTQTLVGLVHPDWDEVQIAAEVKLLEGERAAAQPAIDLGGFGTQDADPTQEPAPDEDDA